MKNKIKFFTDGSSRGNPGAGGYGAIIIFDNKIKEIGGREDNTTNNRMEMMAVISAFDFCDKNIDLLNNGFEVYSDSSYLVNGITKWIFGWMKNNWISSTKEEVLNKDLWEKMYDLVVGKDIVWKRINGHSGIVGNERCDIIATSFADKKEIDLYSGNIDGYEIKNILDISENNLEVKKKSNKGKIAYSYISMIDGKIEIHKTWVECEKRVKGKNAKFKKSLSKEDEGKIVQEFRNVK